MMLACYEILKTLADTEVVRMHIILTSRAGERTVLCFMSAAGWLATRGQTAEMSAAGGLSYPGPEHCRRLPCGP